MVWKVVPYFNLVYLKGSIPGAKGAEVRLRDSTCRKQEKFVASHPPPPFPTSLPGDELFDAHHEDREAELRCPAAADATISLISGRVQKGS